MITPQQFAASRRSLAATLIEALLALFRQPGSWRDDDAAQFIATAVPMVEGAQRALADATAVYVAAAATEALAKPVAPPGIPARDAVDVRYGVTTAEVYRRPFAQIYTGLSEGRRLDEAVDLGATRLEQIAELDMQQTHSRASRAAMQHLPAGQRPTGWRRVLIGDENCAMCVVASTQRYTISTLKPIHPGCDCDVEPLFTRNRDQVIDPELLEAVHDAVEEMTGSVDRGARAPDYRKLVVSSTRTHGELGPMLVRPLDRFSRGPTGPAPA